MSGSATTTDFGTYDFTVGSQLFVFSLPVSSSNPKSYVDCLDDKSKGITVTITEATSSNYDLSAVVKGETLYYLLNIENMHSPDNEGDPNLNLYIENATEASISGDIYTHGYGWECNLSSYPNKSFYLLGGVYKI